MFHLLSFKALLHGVMARNLQRMQVTGFCAPSSVEIPLCESMIASMAAQAVPVFELKMRWSFSHLLFKSSPQLILTHWRFRLVVTNFWHVLLHWNWGKPLTKCNALRMGLCAACFWSFGLVVYDSELALRTYLSNGTNEVFACPSTQLVIFQSVACCEKGVVWSN